MSIFDWFGGGKEAVETVDKMFTAGVSGIDALIYTDEERSVANAKLLDAWIDLQKTLAAEKSDRSINRRLVAWAVVLNTMLFADIALVLALTSRTDIIDLIVKVAQAFHLDWAFSAVIVFYFGPHLLSALGVKK